MASNDVKISGFKEIEAQFAALANPETMDGIERAALRAAGAVMKSALIAKTPMRTDNVGPRDLPAGALKRAVRARTHMGKLGEPSSEVIDFGKLTYIAHFVDEGHINVRAKTGRTHTPAHPFVRNVEAATRTEATDAYYAAMKAGIEKALA